MLRRLVKIFIYYTYRPYALRKLKSDQYYQWKNIRLLIKKGVFHPGLFFSTQFLLRELEKENISGKRLLELGAGSGLVSFRAAVRGAKVTATDINPVAIEGLKLNFAQLGAESLPRIILSDLFDRIPEQKFDYIIINPPYYPRQPETEAEMAWYCGEHYEYFTKLFSTISSYMQPESRVWLSLSEDCNITRIMQIAADAGLALITKKTKYFWGEKNFLFELKVKFIDSTN